MLSLHPPPDSLISIEILLCCHGTHPLTRIEIPSVVTPSPPDSLISIEIPYVITAPPPPPPPNSLISIEIPSVVTATP